MKMCQDFSTQRLRVTHWGALLADEGRRRRLVADLVDVLSPRVMADLPEVLQVEQRAEDIEHWIDARAAKSDVFVVRSESGLAGLLILATMEDGAPRRDVHVGYLFAQTSWGKGFATELLRGLVGAVTKPTRLIGGVGTSNAASARVLEKAGFQRAPDMSSADTDVFVLDVA